MSNRETGNWKKVFDQTLSLMSLYKKSNMHVPFALKGNLGEIWVAIELSKRFENHYIDYRGGAHPEADIWVDSVKIQVKTQIKRPLTKCKSGEYDYESSPTIKKRIIDNKKCDIIILVVFYFSDDYSTIEKSHLYIFDQNDFKYFKHTGCWSGKSKGDYTIFNILRVKGELSPKRKEKIDCYYSSEYKELFQTSKDNWSKIESLLEPPDTS
jgi:hypothetical protein